MFLDLVLKEDFWKALALAIPVITFFFKPLSYLYQGMRSGKLIKLRGFHKEYGEHLDAEDKKFISNQIRTIVTSQLTGIKDRKKRDMLLFILNRCDLKMSMRQLAVLNQYLFFNGRYFYFKPDKKYARKKFTAKVTGVLYFAYGLAPVKYFNDINLFPGVPLPALVFISISCITISIFMFYAYPSQRKIQGTNGRMLNASTSDYKPK